MDLTIVNGCLKWPFCAGLQSFWGLVCFGLLENETCSVISEADDISCSILKVFKNKIISI